MGSYTLDSNRTLIHVKGRDCRTFIQGLITNDILRVTKSQSIYTALLSPQGRYLFDFFIFENTDGLIIDVDVDRQEELLAFLTKYKLRANVELLSFESPLLVFRVFGEDVLDGFKMQATAGFTQPGDGYFAYVDPRLTQLGVCFMGIEQTLKDMHFKKVPYDHFDRLRLSLGVPGGTQDLLVGKSIPLECGFDELNAISWDKGCYLGQELTARTKHQGLVRKRLLPVKIEGKPVEPMTPLMLESQEMGSMRSSLNKDGLALIRLEALEQLGAAGYLTTADDSKLMPFVASWMAFQS
jgi:folate-binding protein YgfZ